MSTPRRSVAPRQRVATFGADREVVSIGLDQSPFHDLYHALLTMPWRRFFALVVLGYLAVNAIFAVGYWELGKGAIENAEAGSFSDDFFFSVQTLATIGYGKMSPHGLAANALVSVEAFLGMMGLAVTTGLLFARFSRPTARVLFSRLAVVAPYEGVPSLMFRMANARGNQIAEARVKLTMVRNEATLEGEPVRRMHDLRLLRSETGIFALTWTAIHPIDPASPLHGLDAEALRSTMADFVVSLTGLDEGLAQTIHARHAFRAQDIRWGARFADILTPGPQRTVIDYRRFDEVVPLGDEASRASPGAERAGGDARGAAAAHSTSVGSQLVR